MKISKRQLRRILKESLLEEGILDDISQGIDYFFQDDEEDRSTSSYQEAEAGAANAREIERASSAAGVTGQVLGSLGWTLQAVRKILAMAGIEEIEESIAERSGFPLHIVCLYNFLALKQSPFELDSRKSRRAMYYVCKAAERNRRSTIHYQDYYDGQKLDPEIAQGKEEGIAYSSNDSYNQITPGIYGQLSLAFGSVNYDKQGDGYFVADRYDFNLDNAKFNWAKTDGYVPTLENISKVVGGDLIDILKIFANKIPGVDVGRTKSLYRLVEDICLMYQTSFKYRGYILSCKTMTAAEAESDSGSQDTSSSSSRSTSARTELDPTIFPDGNLSDERWADFVDDHVTQDKLPEGVTLQKIKTNWAGVARTLGYSGNVPGMNEFISDAKSGKYKESLAGRLVNWATGTAQT